MAGPQIKPDMSLRQRTEAVQAPNEPVAAAQKEGVLPETSSLFPGSRESFAEMIPQLRQWFAGNEEAQTALDYVEYKLETGPFAPEYRGDQAIRDPKVQEYGKQLESWIQQHDAPPAESGDGTPTPLLAAGMGAAVNPEKVKAEKALRGEPVSPQTPIESLHSRMQQPGYKLTPEDLKLMASEAPASSARAMAPTGPQPPYVPPKVVNQEFEDLAGTLGRENAAKLWERLYGENPLAGEQAIQRFQSTAPMRVHRPPRPEWMPPPPEPLTNTDATRRLVSQQQTVLDPDKMGDPRPPGDTESFPNAAKRPGADLAATTQGQDPDNRPGVPTPAESAPTQLYADMGDDVPVAADPVPPGETTKPITDSPIRTDHPPVPKSNAFGTPEEREMFWKMALEKATDGGQARYPEPDPNVEGPSAWDKPMKGPIPKLPGAPNGGQDYPIGGGDDMPPITRPWEKAPPAELSVETPVERAAVAGETKMSALAKGAAAAATGIVVPATMYAIMVKLLETSGDEDVKKVMLKLANGGFDEQPNMNPLPDPEIPEEYGEGPDDPTAEEPKPGIEPEPTAASDKLVADTAGIFSGGGEADQDKLDLKGSLDEVGKRAFERSKKRLEDRDVATKAGIFSGGK